VGLQLRQRLRMTWTARNVAIWGSILVVPSIAAVFLIGKQPAHVEIEWALGLFAGMLFIFLTAGLYGGARWRMGKAEVPSSKELASTVSKGILDGASNAPADGASAGAEAGCVGALIGAVAAILVVVLLAALGYLFTFLGVEAFAVLIGGGAWALYRALRRVFLFSRICEGNLRKSAAHALAFTAMYTGGGFVLLHVLRAMV
jgi:hypothetical protein